MFLVDKMKNEAISLEKKTFQELNFKERKHLQEWICKNPSILGDDELLIIQKEFSGFDETNERLDLLALDKYGNLVVIENKLDDSGKDVVWQALKYASYCSSLSKSDVKDIFQKFLGSSANAEEKFLEFFEADDFSEIEINSDDQQIIMVAANFRKEVTSTAMWLLEHNIRIRFIKVTPYQLSEQILLDTEQIIPVKDAEDYQIKIANKRQEEIKTKEATQKRYIYRREFWSRLLEEMNKKTTLFQNISAGKDSWINCGSGFSGVPYTLVATKAYARVELWINRGSQEENKRIFDELYKHKDEIEASFGHELEWERLNEGKGSRVAYYLRDVSVFNKEEWGNVIDFMAKNMVPFEKSLKGVLEKVVR